MFGSGTPFQKNASPATSAFSGFGTSAFAKPAFGGNTFGQQNTSVFGAQPTGTLFGQATQNPTTPQSTFGTFGQPQQQQPQQTSIFGNTSTTGSTSLFGNQSAFGAAAKPSFGGFGQPQQQQSSLFGQTQPQQQQTTSLFGQTTAAPGQGLFGSNNPTSTFGQPVQNQQNSGTSIAKFQPQQETDTLLKGSTTSYVQTKQQCITFMKEYAEKSLEELRIEDYAANRKGPQNTAGTGLFGSNQTSNVFGQPAQTNTLFGQPATQPTSLFGSTAQNTMGGAQNTSTFGASTSTFGQNTGGLFGKPAGTATTSSGFGGFGTSTSTAFGVAKPMFQSTAPTNTNLFGQAPQNTFGQPATSTFGTTPAFGQSNTLFGATTSAPTFGIGTTSNTATTGFGGFGQTNQSNNLFGTANKPAFGVGNTFGQNQAAPTSNTNVFSGFGQSSSNLFAKPATGFGTFGQPSSQPAPIVSFGNTGGTSLFGSNTQTATGAPGGLFGSTANPSGGGLFGSSQPFGGTTNMSFGNSQPFNSMSQPAAQMQPSTEIHQKILALIDNPYGDNELFKNLKPVALTDSALKATNPMAQKALFESSSNFKISPNSTSKIKVKPISAVVTKKCLFNGLEEYDPGLEDSFTVKSNVKRLIIKPRSNNATPKAVNESESIIKLRDESKVNEKENDAPEVYRNQIPLQPLPEQDQDSDRRVSWLRTAAPSQTIRGRPKLRESIADTTINQFSSNRENESMTKEQLESSAVNMSLLNETFNSTDDMRSEADQSILLPAPSEPHPTGIVLNRAGYYTIPSLDDLIGYMDSEGHCKVPNFTIGRRGYGNVYFDEEIDVAGLNLDDICHFRNKEIILYQDDETKPPIGQELNRKAQVTLDQIWPKDKTTYEPIKDPARLEAMNYEAKLRRICEKRKARFLEYRPETGSCVFKVDHFSKYTLSDSDDEGDQEGEPRADPKKAKVMPQIDKGKKGENGKNGLPVDALKESFLRSKQHESTFVLGAHVGQRGAGFQPYSNTEVEDTLIQDMTTPSIALATEMRTDTHKLQLMKASFFVDDECDTRSIISDITEGRESPDQMVPSVYAALLQPTKYAKTFTEEPMLQQDDDTIVAEKDSVPSKRQQPISINIFKPTGPKSQALIVRPRAMLFDVSDISLPLEMSILHKVMQKKNNTVPFFQGRKFKIGWNFGNRLTILNAEQGNFLFNAREADNFSKTTVNILQMKSILKESNENFNKSLVEHLKIELKHNKKTLDGKSSCHFFEPNGGSNALLEHHKLALKLAKENSDEKLSFDSTVWSLMHAVWGSFDDEYTQEHAVLVLRRDLLSSWLENVVTDSNVIKSNADYLDRLKNLVMCHKINEACDLAFENDDINLSLLLAQSSGSTEVKQLIQHQLYCWHEVEADEFIDERRAKIMMLIGGVSAMDGPKNAPFSIFEDQNWIKCLALQQWYISSPIASVTDVVTAYDKNFNNEDANVAMPNPPYVSHYERDNKYYDIRYHLLKLYSQRGYPMETLLHPANYTTDLMDYRLSFLVLQVLETLGYHHISYSCRLKIYTSLAEQLEANGLWQWSIWIMLHISNENHRESAIHQILYRHIRIDDELDEEFSEREKFIIEELLIPDAWIYWAKAVKAESSQNHQIQLKYLLKAGQWAKAHDVMMQHIAPDLVINDQMDYLKSLLQQFNDTKDIQNWKTQGEILLNFIELNENFTALAKDNDNIDEDLFLEQISPRLSQLCSVIRIFPCPTAKHRLCQSEIAKQLAFIIRNFYAKSSTYGNQAGALMRTALERLPLPQEFAQQELRYVLAKAQF